MIPKNRSLRLSLPLTLSAATALSIGLSAQTAGAGDKRVIYELLAERTARYAEEIETGDILTRRAAPKVTRLKAPGAGEVELSPEAEKIVERILENQGPKMRLNLDASTGTVGFVIDF